MCDEKMYFNGVEITMTFCENCRSMNDDCNYNNYLDYCGCVRVNDKHGHPRLCLETKGNILIKKREMYER